MSALCVTAGVRPFPAGHVAFPFICLPGLSRVVSALFHWPCSISIHLSPRSVTGGVRIFRWPCSNNVAFLFICLPGLSLLVSALFRLVSLLSPFVSGLVSLKVDHCVRLLSLLFPFVSLLVSLLVDVSKGGLGNASLLSHLFGVYGGVIVFYYTILFNTIHVYTCAAAMQQAFPFLAPLREREARQHSRH